MSDYLKKYLVEAFLEETNHFSVCDLKELVVALGGESLTAVATPSELAVANLLHCKHWSEMPEEAEVAFKGMIRTMLERI